MSKVSDKTELTAADLLAADLLMAIDVSAGTSGTKKLKAMSAALGLSKLLFFEDTGGDDAYVISTGLTLSALSNGFAFALKVTTGNTGACTLTVDSVAAKSIKVVDASGVRDPLTGEIPAGGTALLSYNGTYFILMNPAEPTLSNILFVHPDFTQNSGNKYATLSTAITAASAGDEIIILSGSYSLSTVSKAIKINGLLSKGNTIITVDTSATISSIKFVGVNLTSDGAVTYSGCTFIDCGILSGVYTVTTLSNSCKLIGCYLSTITGGTFEVNSTSSPGTGCIIKDCTIAAGISILSGKNAAIYWCRLASSIGGSGTNDCTVNGNVVVTSLASVSNDTIMS